MNRILKRPEVEQLTGKSSSAIYAGMRNNTFPASRRLGPGSVGWLSSEIEEWMENLPIADPGESHAPPVARARAAKLHSVD